MLQRSRRGPSNTIEAVETRNRVVTQLDMKNLDGVQENEDSITHLHISAEAQLMELLKNASKRNSLSSSRTKNSSLGAMKDVADYMEPLYASFFCPLTKMIMEDPVTIQSGVTYEREAISQWFDRRDDLEEVSCPVTGKKLSSRAMFRNIALQSIIEEWKERNEQTKINIIHAALSLGSSESMVMEALKDLKDICQRRRQRIREVCNKGILPLLVKFLEYKDSIIRQVTLEILQLLSEDDEGKELIGKTTAISSTVRMISSRFQPVKHAALLLLVDLSKSAVLSENIGWVTGGILMLIKTKYDRSKDVFASEAANLVLSNLAQSPYNIKCMAENGFLEPLLDNLVGGTENMKVEMASCLAELVVGEDGDVTIAKKASPTLIKMTHSDNASIRKAAFKALVPISSIHQNAEMLNEAGIAQIIVQEMFTRKIYIESSDTLREVAEILANLLESGVNIQKIIVTSQGHTMASDYVVSNIIYMLTNSNVDELSLNLMRIISCLMKWSMPNIVSAIRDSEACYTLVEFINNPDEQLSVAAMKLLINLSPHMGHILVDRLCKIHGQPQGLVQSVLHMSQITEKQASSVKFLAALPHENLQLNLALLSGNTAETVVETIKNIQQSGKRNGSRYSSLYLEGLVGILVRFTSTLYERTMLNLAMNNDLTTVFRDLLMETSNAEVKRLAAIGLEKLSVQSTKLSKPPKVERRPSTNSFYFLSSRSSGKNKITVCPVHGGVCTAQTTFCLIVSRAADALLLCLDQQNTELLEAALSALSTLLDDRVDLDNGVITLNEMKVTEKLMKLVKDHTEETVLQIAYWMIERLSRKGGEDFVGVTLQDKKFISTLLNSFYHGDVNTKQIVEKILMHLRVMPGSTITFGK